MSRLAWTLFAVSVCALTFPGPSVRAQDSAEWEKANAAGIRAFQEGRIAEAEKHMTAALKIAEGFGPTDPRLATSLNSLGVLYGAGGKFEQCEPLFRRALEITEKISGPDSPQVAASINNLAAFYRGQGKLAEAEAQYKRALAIQEKAMGAGDPAVAAALNNLAIVYQTEGKFELAEPAYKRALDILTKAHGAEHPSVAGLLINYASLLRNMNREPEAMTMEARAQAIRGGKNQARKTQ
jgi:tetratricopeptide (TPR) repeat protein